MAYAFPADIEGYSSEPMCRELYRLACLTPTDGTIVELGAYKGRTAITMAMSGRQVWTIDHFQAEWFEFNPLPDHRIGNFSAQEIREHADRYGVRVHVLDAETDEAARFWMATNKPPISMLFIDADHHYEAVKRDFELWSRFCTEDAIIVFDDSLWTGVMQLLMEIEDWAPIPGPQVGQLTAMRRIKETADAGR